MKEHCEVENCNKKVYATAYPEDLDMKLCETHFKLRFDTLLRNAEIIDMTNE